MMKLIDTHAHLNFSAYRDDLDEVIKRTLDQGVQIINVGSQFSTSERAVKIAERYKSGVYAAIGLHPIHLESSHIREVIDENEEFEFDTQNEEFDVEKYRALAKSKKVVAIGETGIDLYHNPDNLDDQRKTFEQEIGLAAELDLPVIIHCRKAYDEVLGILEEKKKEHGGKLRGVVHSYMGKYSLAPKFIALGFSLGFNGVITFARDYDRVIRETALENIIIETDCPYLTPQPYRGKRNEPAYVQYVAEKIAEIKEISVNIVAKTTTRNAKNVFQI
jgi:TatD DNase family protein